MADSEEAQRSGRLKTETNDAEEYEESTFAVELHGLFDEDAIIKSVEDNKCHVHRINSGEPLLQIGSQLFVGKWEEIIGTDMIFKEIPHRHLLNYVGINRKRMMAQRVVLVPKNKSEKEKADVPLQEQHLETMETGSEKDPDNLVNEPQDVAMTIENSPVL